MKQQNTNDSIKEKRGDIKFEIARLQSIIVDSMKRPSLLLSITLEIFLMLQMFRAPFSYLKTLIINSTWAYVPILNYINPAYYQIYLDSFGFLCVLILVVIVMFLYIIQIVLLIITSRHSKFSKILAKITRIELQIFSTILFSSIVKTVLTIFHCSSPNVSTQQNETQFKCLYDQERIWFTWLSMIVLGIFVTLLLIQSYLKFQFYAHQTRKSVLRKSQQWVPILMCFHVIIQIIAITQTQLILMLIMNIIAIIMIFHQSYMDETITKISLGISISLLYLMVFVDLNYFLQFPLSYVLWYFSFFFLMPTCLIFPTLNINYQLSNINKWNSAADRLQYSFGLRTLLSQPKSITSVSFIQGYTDIHYQKCELAHCPYRFNKQALDRIRIFRQNKDLSDSQIKMEQLIIRIYNEGTKYFPNVCALSIQFAIFYYERNMKQRALKYLLGCSIQNISLQQYYKFYRLRTALHHQLIDKGDSTLDLLTQMQMRDLQQQFLRVIEKASLCDIQLWSILLQQHPDFGKLDQVGGQRVEIGQYVKKLYQRISQKGNSQKITALYVQYFINVCKESGNFSDVQDMIKKKYLLNQKIVVFDWVNSSHPSLIISGQENTFGQIEDLNLSAAILLGYQKSQLINRKLSFIMPPELAQSSQELISLKENVKQFYLLRKDNYVIKIKRTIYISSSIMKGSIFICTIQPILINPLSCKILVSNQSPFNIVGMQSKTISFFGIEMRQIDDPISIAQISEVIFHSLEDKTCLNKQLLLCEVISNHIIKRTKFTDSELKQQFIVKTKEICSKIIQIDFFKKKPIFASKVSKTRINQFKFQPIMVDGNLVYSNNLTTNYQYLNNKIQIDSQNNQQATNYKIDYGKGIRIVRLDYDQIQIIQQSSQSQQSQPNGSVPLSNTVGITIQTNNAKGQNKNLLQSRKSIGQFVLNNSIGKVNKRMLVVTTIISMIWFIIICFVFRENHNGIISDLKLYIDQNLKIGQIQIINVLVIQTALMQQNKSNIASQTLISQIQKALQKLQYQKSRGHIYALNTVMLDGTSQILTNLQYIDSLNSNMQDLLSALGNGTIVNSHIINFTINNQILIQPQMVNYLINWDQTLRSSFNKSIIIEIVIIALFIIMQCLLFAFMLFKAYKMFNDKISVLKVFLQISEQNVRIMSIKTQQFLNTLYNNEADIDDQQTIIRKTNNKHTFAIKKKFKLIKRNLTIFILLAIIFCVLVTIPVFSFCTSVQNLVFKKSTLPFVNTTSSGINYFNHNLHRLQMMVYRGQNISTPAYEYISFYRSMMGNFYQSYADNVEFADYWTSVMMEDICQGRLKLEYACTTSTTKNGGMALITDLVLNTISMRNFSFDFAASYYNLYKIIGSLHTSLSNHVLEAFDTTVDDIKKLLIILLIVSLVITPILLIILGLKVMDKYASQIDKTRRMLSLLPIQYLRSCESINQYLYDTVNRKQWILF